MSKQHEDNTQPQDSGVPETVDSEAIQSESVQPTITQGLILKKTSIKTKFRNTLLLSIISLAAVAGIGLFSETQLINALTEQQANAVAVQRQGEVFMMHNALNADALNLVLFAHVYDESKDKGKQVDTFKKLFEEHKKTLLTNLNMNGAGSYNANIAIMSQNLIPIFDIYFEKLDDIEAATRFLLAVQDDKSEKAMKEKGFDIGHTNSPVTPIYMKGDVPEATQMVMDLRENFHIFCSIVVYPVIPKGDIIFRLIPTAAHSNEDIDITLNAFEATKKKLDAGEYVAVDIPDMAEKV